MVNKNKTIINNKNIIQICTPKTKRQRQTKRQSGNNNPSSNNPDTNLYSKNIPSYYSPAYTFPNSSALEDEAKRVRFINAMRDPTATKSPYSLFDSGSNTFPREGNTTGSEQPIQPQISQSDYFSNPRSLVRPAVRFASDTSQFSESAISPIGRDFYDGYRFEEDNREQQEQQQTRFGGLDLLPMSSLFGSPFRGSAAIDPHVEQEAQQEVDDRPIERTDARFQLPETTRFNSSNKPPIPFTTPFRQPEPMTAQLPDEAIISDEQAQQLADAKDMEEAQALDAELTTIRKEEERHRTEKLNRELKESRKRLAGELDRKKAIQTKFKAVTDKLNEFIKTGEKKVKKKSELKEQIIELLKDETFTEFQGTRNIGARADAQKILDFLNEGSKTLIAEMEQIEKDKIELEKHPRNAPASRANLRTLPAAGGGGKVGGAIPARK
jgi:hypothetical protein